MNPPITPLKEPYYFGPCTLRDWAGGSPTEVLKAAAKLPWDILASLSFSTRDTFVLFLLHRLSLSPSPSLYLSLSLCTSVSLSLALSLPPSLPDSLTLLSLARSHLPSFFLHPCPPAQHATLMAFRGHFMKSFGPTEQRHKQPTEETLRAPTLNPSAFSSL